MVTEEEVNHWISKYGWRDDGHGEVYVANQEESIKTKNITEKITFDSKTVYMFKYYTMMTILQTFSSSLFDHSQNQVR